MIINRLLLLVVLSVAYVIVSAQEKVEPIHIEPVNSSSVNKWRTDIYAFATWSGYENGNLWTANNNTGKDNKDCYLNFTELGLGVYLNKDRGFIFEGNFGYSYGTIAYTRKLFPDSNIGSHWITLDTNISHTSLDLLYGGIKSSVFVSSTINSRDNYSFEGFYNDCFNPMTIIPYIGIRLQFQFLKLDVRIGGQIVPYINANKIAYHNMHKTHISGTYIEIRLGTRIFSTSNPSRSIK